MGRTGCFMKFFQRGKMFENADSILSNGLGDHNPDPWPFFEKGRQRTKAGMAIRKIGY